MQAWNAMSLCTSIYLTPMVSGCGLCQEPATAA